MTRFVVHADIRAEDGAFERTASAIDADTPQAAKAAVLRRHPGALVAKIKLCRATGSTTRRGKAARRA